MPPTKIFAVGRAGPETGPEEAMQTRVSPDNFGPPVLMPSHLAPLSSRSLSRSRSLSLSLSSSTCVCPRVAASQQQLCVPARLFFPLFGVVSVVPTRRANARVRARLRCAAPAPHAARARV
eukprot:scaffold106_cov246-Pinguiococcus_pyrenoidosus.AAC.21